MLVLLQTIRTVFWERHNQTLRTDEIPPMIEGGEDHEVMEVKDPEPEPDHSKFVICLHFQFLDFLS